MRVRWLVLLMVAAVALGNVGARSAARAAPPAPSVAPGACDQGTLPSGAGYKICRPPTAEIGLVIWAHGYIAPADGLSFQDAPPENPVDLATLIRSYGFGYAATTYRANGLVVQDAKQDVLELLAQVYAGNPELQPLPVYLIGASMGGLIVTQLAESNPNGAFDGALALCGIVGSFPREINYWGNYNLLFRALFPGLVAGWGSAPPSSATTTAAWKATYEPGITSAVIADPSTAGLLLATSKAAVDPANPTATGLKSIQDMSYYSLLSADDSAARLGGNPLDNSSYWYAGTGSPASDWALNLQLPRYHPSPAVAQAMAAYETTGNPAIPMVTLHTTLDPIVPVDQSLLYMLKLQQSGNTKVSPLLVDRYGHCNFTEEELTKSFGLLVFKVTGVQLPGNPNNPFVPDAEVATRLAAFASAEAAPPTNTFARFYAPTMSR